MSTLAERINEAIEASGKQGHEIAAACGVTPAAVTHWRNGSTKTLKALTAQKLSEVTGYREKWLLTGLGQKKDVAPSFLAGVSGIGIGSTFADDEALIFQLSDGDVALRNQWLAEAAAFHKERGTFGKRPNQSAPTVSGTHPSPAFVIPAAVAQPENLRTRPELRRAILTAITNLAGPHNLVKDEFQFQDRHQVDMAILDSNGKPKALIECKTYKLHLGVFYKPAYLSGECWLIKHDANGQPAQDAPPLFHIGLLENADGASEPSGAVPKLQANYRQLVGGKLVDGFTLLRVANMPNGETQLFDLPDAPESMALLMGQMKQAAK